MNITFHPSPSRPARPVPYHLVPALPYLPASSIPPRLLSPPPPCPPLTPALLVANLSKSDHSESTRSQVEPSAHSVNHRTKPRWLLLKPRASLRNMRRKNDGVKRRSAQRTRGGGNPRRLRSLRGRARLRAEGEREVGVRSEVCEDEVSGSRLGRVGPRGGVSGVLGFACAV